MRSADVVNLCLGHDQALAGLYRGVTEFSQALNAPILSVEPAERAYDPCEGEVCRLEATGSLALVSSHYMNKAASVAAASFLNDTRLLIVHSLFRGHVGFAMRWAAESRRHYWAVPHGCLDPWGMAYHGIQKRLWMAAIGNRYLAHARRVIFSSKREAEKAAAWTRGAKSAVVHFPVRFPDLSRRDAARHQLRVKLGISEDARILLYAGRLHSMKRPRALLHAFLRAEAANLVLVVVGEIAAPISCGSRLLHRDDQRARGNELDVGSGRFHFAIVPRELRLQPCRGLRGGLAHHRHVRA